MPRKVSAKRYAQAAFELALEQDKLEHWEAGLNRIGEALEVNELRAFLGNAKIPLAVKVQTIQAALGYIDPLMLNLLNLLVSRGISDLLPDVLTAYRHLLDQHRGREQVDLYSAVPLEDNERQQIATFVEGFIHKEVVLESMVDPSILAGLVIRVGDKLIDGSARTRLQLLSRDLKTGAIPH